jgi:hypothetical protein
MKKINIFCFSVEDFHVLNKLPKNIIPFGLGDKNFPNNWLNEKNNENILKFNKHFGEATGMYWIWKNKLKEYSKNDWIGFCQYRRLWLDEFLKNKQKFSTAKLFSKLLKNDNQIFDNSESILLQPILFKSDSLRTQFEKNYGSKILKDCLDFLEPGEKYDFKNYLEGNSLSICNMFITNPIIFDKYCNSMFDWIFKCYAYCFEKNLLKGKNMRLPIFLVERYTSFWFHKHTQVNYLSFARLGNFYLSNFVNKFINPLNVPFTFGMYPTIHKF